MNKIIPTCLFLVLAWTACPAQSDINSKDIRGEVVYQDDNVVFRKIDDNRDSPCTTGTVPIVHTRRLPVHLRDFQRLMKISPRMFSSRKNAHHNNASPP